MRIKDLPDFKGNVSDSYLAIDGVDSTSKVKPGNLGFTDYVYTDLFSKRPLRFKSFSPESVTVQPQSIGQSTFIINKTDLPEGYSYVCSWSSPSNYSSFKLIEYDEVIADETITITQKLFNPNDTNAYVYYPNIVVLLCLDKIVTYDRV